MSATNYFAVSTMDTIGWDLQSSLNPGITVQEAYMIDNKIDDGLPQSGAVIACYMNYNVSNTNAIVWRSRGQWYPSGAERQVIMRASAAITPYATTNCYDNNNVSLATQQYSITKNANLQNCALSFRFQ